MERKSIVDHPVPRQTYAVVWEQHQVVASGGLTVLPAGFELHGRDRPLSIAFSEVLTASIARGGRDRLRGLPVLVLALQGGEPLRIASLEGLGGLHELAAHVEAAGLQVEL